MPPARIVFYLSTLGGIAVAVRSVLTEPPPLWAAVTAATFYVAVVVAGALALRLRMFADAVVRGPADARGVVLTFDATSSDLPALLDALDRHEARATFFFLGRSAEADPTGLRAIVERGHDVGVHGYEDDPMLVLRGPRRVRRDLERAVRAIEKVTKTRPAVFRPLGGRTSPTMARIADQLDLTMIGWSATPDSRDLADGRIVRIGPDAGTGMARVWTAIDSKNLRVARLGDWLDAFER